LTPWWRWGEGPTKVWQEAVEAQLIARATLYKNGRPVSELTGRPSDCIWAVGYYNKQSNQRN
jgi:hypothetical protein